MSFVTDYYTIVSFFYILICIIAKNSCWHTILEPLLTVKCSEIATSKELTNDVRLETSYFQRDDGLYR